MSHQVLKYIKNTFLKNKKSKQKWLMTLIMKVLNFLFLKKKILVVFNIKTIFALMYFVMKMI